MSKMTTTTIPLAVTSKQLTHSVLDVQRQQQRMMYFCWKKMTKTITPISILVLLGCNSTAFVVNDHTLPSIHCPVVIVVVTTESYY